MLVNYHNSFFQKLEMEGPDVEGPKVWVELELNKKSENMIIGLIEKNEVCKEIEGGSFSRRL